MLDVPPATPVTIPDELPTVATVVVPLVHVPPPVTSFNVVVLPTHSENVPVIGLGNVFTVTVAVT